MEIRQGRLDHLFQSDAEYMADERYPDLIQFAADESVDRDAGRWDAPDGLWVPCLEPGRDSRRSALGEVEFAGAVRCPLHPDGRP